MFAPSCGWRGECLTVRKQSPNKQEKDPGRQLSKEDTQVAKKATKECPTPLHYRGEN